MSQVMSDDKPTHTMAPIPCLRCKQSGKLINIVVRFKGRKAEYRREGLKNCPHCNGFGYMFRMEDIKNA